MQLTTPEIKEYDSVFPGENWFLYWKTSPSLWRTKLAEFSWTGPIFIPIYWGIHNEHNEQYDFGTYKPETDLVKLANIAGELGREIVAVLPVSPAPFLPNGGIPSYISHTTAIAPNGLAMAFVDSENRLHKIYSMFDPKVFQAYRKFAWNFGQYLIRSGIDWEVVGGQFGFHEDGKFNSYLLDSSLAFEQGFNRYIKQLQDNHPDRIEKLLESPEKELEIKNEFFGQIQDLYIQAASESVSGSWGKVLQFTFLGGNPMDIFSRTSEMWEHESNFFHPLFESFAMDLIPSSVLIGPHLKKGVLNKCLKDLVNSSYIQRYVDNIFFEDDTKAGFAPLVFFNIHKHGAGNQVRQLCRDLGVFQFIQRDYKWTGMLSSEIDFEELHTSGKIHFCFGEFLDMQGLNNVIKLFMHGARVLLDTTKLSVEAEQRLNQFLTENAFEVEQVKFKSTLRKVTLGEGVLILYERGPLLEMTSINKISFWNALVNFLKIKHLKIDVEETIYYYWRSRPSNTYELNYEEIRRLSIYNPSSYKKKMHITSSTNFAFLRSVDSIRTDVKSTPVGISVELMPGGSVSLDFGYYE